jgi:hypothetical protein
MKQTKVDVLKTLIEWAREYFKENKEVLKLFGINNADELQNRILGVVNQNLSEKSKQPTPPQKELTN